jgi:alkylation response protein AidB-like acyl-CoA dehydrogenase
MVALYQRARDTLPEEKTSETSDNKSRQLFAELHATSCGLKALATTAAAEGLEVARRACGGHGYSSFSGIGPWYLDYVPTTTWEGDNFMLTQQVAKYVRPLLLSHTHSCAHHTCSYWASLAMCSRAGHHIMQLAIT